MSDKKNRCRACRYTVTSVYRNLVDMGTDGTVTHLDARCGRHVVVARCKWRANQGVIRVQVVRTAV